MSGRSLAVFGWAVLFRSAEILRYAAVVALLFHLVVLVIEEPSLRRLFGVEYEEYCRSDGDGFRPSR